MKIKSIFIAIILSAFLCSCSDSANKLNFPALPPELSDCVIYELLNTSGDHIKIARCPNSTTTSTYTSGKTSTSTIIVDGVEYIKKKN
jgi:hypothetical protein